MQSQIRELPASQAAELAAMQSLVHAWHRANGTTWNSKTWQDKTEGLRLQQADLLDALTEFYADEQSGHSRLTLRATNGMPLRVPAQQSKAGDGSAASWRMILPMSSLIHRRVPPGRCAQGATQAAARPC